MADEISELVGSKVGYGFWIPPLRGYTPTNIIFTEKYNRVHVQTSILRAHLYLYASNSHYPYCERNSAFRFP
jgi:hypothetical protein